MLSISHCGRCDELVCGELEEKRGLRSTAVEFDLMIGCVLWEKEE